VGLLAVLKIITANGSQAAIQLVNERLACGDFQMRNILIGNPVEIFDEAPQTIAVGGISGVPPSMSRGSMRSCQ